MAEYIEKNVAIARLTALEIGNPCATMTDAKRQIADTRAANVAPVVHGRWIRHDDGVVACNRCGNAESSDSYYCRYCGAVMDGGADHDA